MTASSCNRHQRSQHVIHRRDQPGCRGVCVLLLDQIDGLLVEADAAQGLSLAGQGLDHGRGADGVTTTGPVNFQACVQIEFRDQELCLFVEVVVLVIFSTLQCYLEGQTVLGNLIDPNAGRQFLPREDTALIAYLGRGIPIAQYPTIRNRGSGPARLWFRTRRSLDSSSLPHRNRRRPKPSS